MTISDNLIEAMRAIESYAVDDDGLIAIRGNMANSMRHADQAGAIRALYEFLWLCNNAYHTSGRSLITDIQFDFLERCYKAAGGRLAVDFSAVSRPKKTTRKHSVPMLSLDKAYSADDIVAFIKRMARYLNTDSISMDFVGELKVDGVAFAATYVDGQYMAGYSRGDGIEGEDLTENLRSIMPLNVSYRGDIEVRGEVYIRHDDFAEINAGLEASEQFGTPRNLVAGTLKLLDLATVQSRKLRYFAYTMLSEQHTLCKTHLECLGFLKIMGFAVNDLYEHLTSVDDIERYHAKMAKEASDLQYDCDGLVIKVNNLSLQYRLGSTEKHPRWAVAYKFSNPEACTEVEDIMISVGRTGAIVPVAKLKPVKIRGVIVSRATLHNFDNLRTKDVRIGDSVTIERAGDVIPQVVEVIPKRDRGPQFVAPMICPSCHSGLVHDKNQGKNIILRCPASMTCPAQRFARLVHAVSRDALNIDGIGEKQLKQLWDIGLVAKLSDIFALRPESLVNLPRWGNQSINNTMDNINKVRNGVTLDRVIFALSIRHVGKDIATILAVHCKTIESFIYEAQNGFLEVATIGKIGPRIVESMRDFWDVQGNRDEVIELTSCIKILPCEAVVVTNTEFSGKKVVFTGKLSSISRDEAKNIMTKLGATVASTVTGITDYVIVGEKSGSKLTKSRLVGAIVLNEEEWLNMIKKYDTL